MKQETKKVWGLLNYDIFKELDEEQRRELVRKRTDETLKSLIHLNDEEEEEVQLARTYRIIGEYKLMGEHYSCKGIVKVECTFSFKKGLKTNKYEVKYL